MTLTDTEIKRQAVVWIRNKSNQQLIIDQFANTKRFPSGRKSIVIFMAGSPGAGKTEFARMFVDLDDHGEFDTKMNFVVIDADKLRKFMPGYTGSNSHLFQNAVSIGVDVLFRSVLRNKQNCIFDGTFAHLARARDNVKQVLDASGIPGIFYVFQQPEIAWQFTQQREAVEGRKISKDAFVDKLLCSKENVERIKNEFGNKVHLSVILKDFKDSEHNKKIAKVFPEVEHVAKYTQFTYSKDEIERSII